MDVSDYFARYGPVEELVFDDEFFDHMLERGTYRKHQVSVAEIVHVHLNTARYFLNTGTHRAPVIMIGPTAHGRFIIVPIEPAGQHGQWRPVTAMEANAHHKQQYEGSEQ